MNNVKKFADLIFKSYRPLNSKQEEAIGKLKNKLGIDDYKVSGPDSTGLRVVTFDQAGKKKVYHMDRDGHIAEPTKHGDKVIS
jgi:hypothetical protein